MDTSQLHKYLTVVTCQLAPRWRHTVSLFYFNYSSNRTWNWGKPWVCHNASVVLKRVELSGDASKSSFFASAKFCLTWEKEWPNFHPEAMKVVKKLAHYCFFRQLGLLSNFNVIQHRRLRPNGLVVCLLASVGLWSFFLWWLQISFLAKNQ